MELTPYIENHFRQLILLSYNPFFESLFVFTLLVNQNQIYKIILSFLRYTAPGSTLTQEQADGLKHQFVDRFAFSFIFSYVYFLYL